MSKKQTQWSKNFNSKTYKMLSVRLPIRLVDDFKTECQKRSVPQAQVIRRAVEEFLETVENGEPFD
jgi:predicted DNA-binding protein